MSAYPNFLFGEIDSTAVIPLIAVTYSDLYRLGEVLENVTPEGWINWDKHCKFAGHIWSVKRFMRARYYYKGIPEIQDYISHAPVYRGEKTMAAIAKLRDDFCTTEEARQIDLAKADAPKKKEIKSEESELTDKEWALMEKGGQQLKYKSGETVLELGTVGNYLIRVRKGTSTVYTTNQGTRLPVAMVKQGSMYGEMSLLRGKLDSSSMITAETDTEITRYSIDYVLGICHAVPVFSERLNKILSLRLADPSKTSKPRQRRQRQQRQQRQRRRRQR